MSNALKLIIGVLAAVAGAVVQYLAIVVLREPAGALDPLLRFLAY